MKSFKDFVKKKKEISWLDIPSFAETRHLPTDSKHNVNESLDQFTYVRWQPWTNYTGVPEHIGNKIRRSKPGTDHYFPGFTSSTSVQYNAHEFANRYNKGKTPHVIQFHALPGSVRSFAHHSRFGEHEFGIHHGARATYSPSTKESDGTLVHHMILHPDHLELDDYRRNQ